MHKYAQNMQKYAKPNMHKYALYAEICIIRRNMHKDKYAIICKFKNA